MTIDVEAREVVRAADRPVPAFRVRIAVRRDHVALVDHRHRRGGEGGEPAGPRGGARDARAGPRPGACPDRIRTDMLEAAAVVPDQARRIDDPGAVELLRLRLDERREPLRGRPPGRRADGARATCSRSATRRRCGRAGRSRGRRATSAPEPFIESDAPEIVAEARDGCSRRHRRARAGRAPGAPRERAAREEADREPALRARGPAHARRRLQRAHGALRRAGPRERPAGPDRGRARVPARRASTTTPGRRSTWRSAAAGCGCRSTPRSTSSPPTPRTSAWRAAASTARRSCCRLIGRLKMTVLDLQLAPGSTPVLVGRPARARPRRFDIPLPRREDGPGLLVGTAVTSVMIRVQRAGQALRAVHRRRRRRPRRRARARSTASWGPTAPARRPPSASSRACCSRPRAASTIAGHDLAQRARGGQGRRSASSPTGPSSTRS